MYHQETLFKSIFLEKRTKVQINHPNDIRDVSADCFESMENDSFEAGRSVGATDQAQVRQVRKELTDQPLETLRELKKIESLV